MTAAWVLLSLLCALGFYLATPHQRVWPAGRSHARALRAGAWACAAGGIAAAVAALGTWSGVFAMLTALMLWLVLLPYADAWHSTRNAR